jgi:hypothetical protein
LGQMEDGKQSSHQALLYAHEPLLSQKTPVLDMILLSPKAPRKKGKKSSPYQHRQHRPYSSKVIGNW